MNEFGWPEAVTLISTVSIVIGGPIFLIWHRWNRQTKCNHEWISVYSEWNDRSMPIAYRCRLCGLES